jgi:hypothetical protein
MVSVQRPLVVESPRAIGISADPASLQPLGYLRRVEPNQSPDLVVRDASFCDNAADVAHGDAQLLGELLDTY